MIEFGGTIYHIDLDAYGDTIKLNNYDPRELLIESVTKTTTDESGKVISTEVLETKRERGADIDSTKYELVRVLIDVLMDDVGEDDDDTLGVDRALEKRALSYRIAFNTLMEYGILKEI
jgi:hypothetical protein